VIISRTSMPDDWVIGKIIKASGVDGYLYNYCFLFGDSTDFYPSLEVLNNNKVTKGCNVVALYKPGIRAGIGAAIDEWMRTPEFDPSTSVRYFTMPYAGFHDVSLMADTITRAQYVEIMNGGSGPVVSGNRNALTRMIADLQWTVDHPDIYFFVLHVQAPLKTWIKLPNDTRRSLFSDRLISRYDATARYWGGINAIGGIGFTPEVVEKADSVFASGLSYVFLYDSYYDLRHDNAYLCQKQIDDGATDCSVSSITVSSIDGIVNESLIVVEIIGCVNQTYTMTYNDGVFTCSGVEGVDYGVFDPGSVYAPINPFPVSETGDHAFFTINSGAVSGTWLNGDSFTFATVSDIVFPFGTIGSVRRGQSLAVEVENTLDENGERVPTGWYRYLPCHTTGQVQATDAIIRGVIEGHIAGQTYTTYSEYNHYLINTTS